MTTDDFDARVRALVLGLVDRSPSAPPMPRVEAVESRRRRHRHRAIAALALSVAVASGAGAAVTSLLRTGPGMTRLFLRTTATGVRIRLYDVAPPRGDARMVQAQLSTDSAVGLVEATYVSAPPARDVLALTSGVFGAGASGGFATIVHVGAGVTEVSARFATGAVDSMAPVAGWAVVAHAGTGSGGTVTGYDSSGRAVATEALPAPTSTGSLFPGESRATFTRTTAQGVLVIGHTVQTGPNAQPWLYPYFADGAAVQLGLEGIPACRASAPLAVDAGVAVVGVSEGEPITVVVLYAGRDVARVSIRYANGVTDSMATVSGDAVLATLGTIDRAGDPSSIPRATLDAYDANGQLVRRLALNARTLSYGGCAPLASAR